jgi:sorting and assembly machinery component 37
MLAAHVLLLVQAPLPDTLLSSLISSSYPTLLLHARRVLEIAAPSARVLPPERYSLSALIPYPSFRTWWSGPRPQKSEEEKRFDRMRWQWIGLAVVGSIGYWIIWGPKLRFVRVDDDDEVENLAIVIEDETGDEGADEDEGGLDEPADEDEGDGKAAGAS